MATAAGQPIAVPASANAWANTHLDYQILNDEIEAPLAQHEQMAQKRIMHEYENRKYGMILVRCGGYEWHVWAPKCTLTSNAFKQWVATKWDPLNPLKPLELSLLGMNPYVLDRIVSYYFLQAVKVPEDKRITVASVDKTLFPRAYGVQCSMSTMLVLINMYDAAWEFEDTLLKRVVLSIIRRRLLKSKYAVPEFLEAIHVVSHRTEANECNDTLKKIFLTAVVLCADDFVLSDEYCDAFLKAQSPAFKDRFIMAHAWYNKHYRQARQTVMEY